jgi:hypothetical protein
MSDRFHDTQSAQPVRRGTVMLSTQQGLQISACVDGAYLEQVVPYGMISKPCEQDEVLLLPVENGRYVLLGQVTDSSSLSPGEVLLKAKSGASVYLKSDGTVEINGLVISADGKIQE